MAAADSRLGPGTLTLEANDFATQAAAVRLTPAVDSADGTPTLADPEPAPETTVSWALNIDAIQDFEEPAGLVNYLMDNALSEVPFEWTPLTPDGTKYAGTVQIVPIEVGGDVAVQVVTSVELPVVGQPTRTDGVGTREATSSRSRRKDTAATETG
jgi:hypothetical protein